MGFLKSTSTKRAVAGYRHSAEDAQENSVPLQREFVRSFARKHDIEIIHEEADEGKSGLTADRPGFRRLFDDWILNPKAPSFDYVLIYDVSRWGRFEDADEAGYYEFQCRQMGKQVIYARRGFPESEEQKGMFQVQTAFERWMSFQYVKKLSEDVIRGCLEISSQGYSVGGQAPYGLARMLLSAGDRKQIRIMEHGERKSVANERITFVPKGDQSTEVVKRIFNRFLDGNCDLNEIAKELNAEGILASNGGEWHRGKIYHILRNPAYKGTLVYNKTWGRLKRQKRNNPVSDWIICPDAFSALIDPQYYDRVQEQLHWLLPSHYRKGHYMLKRVKKEVYTGIESILKKNNIDADHVRHIPLALAVKRYLPDGVPYWCFMISPKIESSKDVLCVGVDMGKQDSIDRTFLIPTKSFTLIGMCLLTEKDERYSEWLRKEEEVEDVVIALLNNVCNNKNT